MSTKNSNTDVLLQEFDRWTFWGAISLIIILIGVYFLIAIVFKNLIFTELKDFILAILSNIIPTFILFIFSYFLFRKIQNIRDDHHEQRLVSLIKEEIIHFQKDIMTANNIENTSRKVKILFMSASPIDNPPIRADSEIRSIKEALRLSRMGNYFELISEIDVRKSELQPFILAHKPDILHICANSNTNGIILEDEERRSDIISQEEICRLLASFNDVICLVIRLYQGLLIRRPRIET